MTQRKLKTPFAGLLPPLSTTEYEALKADIKENGVRDAVDIDERHPDGVRSLTKRRDQAAKGARYARRPRQDGLL